MYANHMSTAWWVLASLGGLIVLGLTLWTLYSVISSPHSKAATDASPATASEVLERRLAAGEIDTEEYEQIRSTINAAATPSPTERRIGTRNQPPRPATPA
jgi:putative membrane protein